MSTPDTKELLARSIVEVRALRQKLADAERARREPIAVVGIGCRFPGGAAAIDSPEAFFRFLLDGGDAVTDLPPGRWPGSAAAGAALPPGMYVRRAAWLDAATVEGFDARFFGVTERELRSLDPQHRLVLQVAWEALEHAAIAPDRLRRTRTGVFVGISQSDYAHLLAEHTPPEALDGYFGPGTALSFAPGRLSYFLGLQGPSLAVDTACSSSLVAVHLACGSLRAGESDLALAGGVNLILSPAGHLVLCKARVLSPEGRCKTFDVGADGYVRGEGCGFVVLKRLSDALAGGDRVLAVIRGSAVNQDGPSSGLTVPNAAAQEAVIRDALASAGVEPRDVAYVEAHGTGTPLGDPIEARALAAALGPGRPAERPLLLGTVKTNIGHLESAAGIAGLIKLVLALHHGELPRHLHLRSPNPAVDWERLPLSIAGAQRRWPDGARIGGVSSFGASGTNAHVVVEAAPVEAAAAAIHEARPELLVLSAPTESALRTLAGRYAQHLAAHPEQPIADVCFTAAVGRARLAHALAVIGDAPSIRDALRAFADEGAHPAVRTGVRPREAPRPESVLADLAPSLREAALALAGTPAPSSEDAIAAWLRTGAGARRPLLDALAELAVRGVEVRWPALFAGARRRRITLPTLPFSRDRHPMPSGPSGPPRRDVEPPVDPLLGRRLDGTDARTVAYESLFEARALGVLRDHRVYGRIVVSGTVHAALFARALQRVAPDRRILLEDLQFLTPLILPEQGAVRVRTSVTADPEGDASTLELAFDAGGVATVCTRGRARPMPDASPPARDLAALLARCPEPLAGDDFYARFWRPEEHALGPSFRTIERIHRRDGEALARLRPPPLDPSGPSESGRLDADLLLGVCLGEVYGQILMPAVPDFEAVVRGLTHTFLGQRIDRALDHGGAPHRAAWAHAVFRSFDGDELTGDVALLDEDGAVLVEIEGLRARRVPRALVEHAVARMARDLEVGPASPPAAAPPAGPRASLLDGDPSARADRVLRYLRERIAAVAGGAPDFEPGATLASLGVDSLMAVDLDEAIRADLGVAFPLDHALQGEDLAQLAGRLLDALVAAAPAPVVPDQPPAPVAVTSSTAAAPRTPWLRPVGDWPARPRALLVGFPHGGAGPTAFLPWRGRLPADVAALAVQLPGRWDRLAEPPIDRLDALVAALHDALRPHLDRPFVFFGASLGALLAFELTRALRRAGGPLPAHLVAAAYPAPDLPNPLLAHRDLLRAALDGNAADAAALLRPFGLVPEPLLEADMLRLLLPALRADLELVLAHAHRAEAPLAVPITALAGTADREVPADALAPWFRQTDAEFRLRRVPGDHLFYRTNPDETLAALADILARAADPPAPASRAH